MNNLFILLLLTFLVSPISSMRIRDSPVNATSVAPDLTRANTTVVYPDSIYDCPAANGTRNDTIVDFYTMERMPDEPWLRLDVEVPKTAKEFMCGMANRRIDPKCKCGYMLAWDDAAIRQFYLRSVPFNSELYFLNKYKQVLAIANSTAFAPETVYTPEDTQYVILTRSGIATQLTVQVDDPVKVAIPKGMFIGTGSTNHDDKVGMHN